MLEGELQGELRDIAALGGAMGGGGAGGGLHFFGLLEPSRERGVGKEAGAEGSGVHHADTLRLQVGHRLVGEAGVLERVLVVAQHAIDLGLVADEPEDLLRVAAEADGLHLAGLLGLAEGRDRLVDDLLHRDELDVVAEDDVEVVGAEAVQGDVDALRDALGAEVEVLEVVAAELRAELVAVARHAAEGDAEEHFGHPAAVEGRRVDEVEAAVEGDLDGLQGVVEGDAAEFLAERRGAEAEDREFDPGLTEGTGLHRTKVQAVRQPTVRSTLPQRAWSPVWMVRMWSADSTAL